MSQMNFEKKFGQSSIFVTSTLMEEGGVPPSSSPASQLKEAIHVISCGYEDKTEWGIEVTPTKASYRLVDILLYLFTLRKSTHPSCFCFPKCS